MRCCRPKAVDPKEQAYLIKSNLEKLYRTLQLRNLRDEAQMLELQLQARRALEAERRNEHTARRLLQERRDIEVRYRVQLARSRAVQSWIQQFENADDNEAMAKSLEKSNKILVQLTQDLDADAVQKLADDFAENAKGAQDVASVLSTPLLKTAAEPRDPDGEIPSVEELLEQLMNLPAPPTTKRKDPLHKTALLE